MAKVNNVYIPIIDLTSAAAPRLPVETSKRRLAVITVEKTTAGLARQHVVRAVEATHGAKPDPTPRLELLHDKDGKLPETVSLRKACEYARVTKRRIEQTIADGKVKAVGGHGHRRILVASLIRYYPPEK